MNIKNIAGRDEAASGEAIETAKSGLGFVRVCVFTLCICVLSGLYLGIVHNVSTKITNQDTIALNKIMEQAGYQEITDASGASYRNQISSIRAIQDAVLKTSPILRKIPLRQTREPADLLASRHGQCSDRARTMQKALIAAGFETRFAALFSRDKMYTPPETMAIDTGRDLRSHAVVEVKTERGWLVVDTNDRFISLGEDDQPISLAQWSTYLTNKKSFKWSAGNEGDVYWLMKRPFTIAYGLYSRHGLFYPPFTRYIPDVNISEFVLNNLNSMAQE